MLNWRKITKLTKNNHISLYFSFVFVYTVSNLNKGDLLMWNQEKYQFPTQNEWKQFRQDFEHQKDCIVCACNLNDVNTIETIRTETSFHLEEGSKLFEMMVRWVECFVTVTIYQ